MKQSKADEKAGPKAKKPPASVRDLPILPRKAKAIRGGGIRLSNHNETLLGAAD